MTPTSRLVAPIATFAVVAGIAVAAVLLPGSGGPDRPPVLRLAGSAGTLAADSARAGGGGYAVTGPLPEGQPPDAPVFALTGSRDLGRLREVLGEGVWLSRRAWYWSSCAKDRPAGTDDGPDSPVSSGCAVAAPVRPGSAPRQPLSEDAVRGRARPVFAAVGLDVAAATVTTTEYGGTVTLSRRLGDLRVAGWTTTVSVDQDNELQFASGYLGTPAEGAAYPLLSAQEAADRLPAPVRMDVCQVAPDGKGCLEPPAPEITAAELGLQLVTDAEGEQLLVPAWLFTLKGSPEPLAQVAVDPSFLGTPPTEQPGQCVATKAEGDCTDGSGTGTDPATGAPGSTEPATGREAVAFDSAFRGSTPDALVVQYGQSGSCPRSQVTYAVKETDDAVYVVLEADAYPPDTACTSDYRPVRLTVGLKAPLGDRKVYDGSRDAQVRLS